MSAHRTYGTEKVDLGILLVGIVSGTSTGPGAIAASAAQYFNCSERAVKDALTILRRSGYVEVERDEVDGRRRRLVATERGKRLTIAPLGWSILRLARRLFTTCPSPTVSAYQAGLAEMERHERLAHAEATLLGQEAA